MITQTEWIVRDREILGNLLSYLAQLPLEKPWRVSIKPYKKKRSLSQNRMYHAEVNEIVRAVADFTGYTHEEIHEFLKQKFLSPDIIEIGGERHERWTTTNLGTAEMSDYMEQVRRWAIEELGIDIPILADA
jgi:hypothetical protein